LKEQVLQLCSFTIRLRLTARAREDLRTVASISREHRRSASGRADATVTGQVRAASGNLDRSPATLGGIFGVGQLPQPDAYNRCSPGSRRLQGDKTVGTNPAIRRRTSAWLRIANEMAGLRHLAQN
jgi:hypothetical protein